MRTIQRLFLALSLSVFAAVALGKSPGSAVPVKSDRLAGVWLMPDKGGYGVTARLVVLAGEANATGPEGLAHYTEHLVIRSIDLSDGEDSAQHKNAWTTAHRTVYTASGSSRDLDDLVEHIAKVLDGIEVSEEIAQTERDVVTREYGVRLGVNKFARTQSDAIARLHRDTPQGRSVIGDPTSINALTLADAKAFHADFYTPENAVLLVTGDVSPRKLRRAVSRHFKTKVSPNAGLAQATFAVPAAGRVQHTVERDKKLGEEVWWLRSVAATDADDPLQRQLELSLLADLMESRLQGSLARALRFDEFVLARFNVATEVHTSGYWSIQLLLYPDVGVSADTALARTSAFLDALRRDGVPGASLEKLKARQLSQLADTDPAALAFNTAESALELRQPPESVDALRARIERITAADVNRLLEALATPTREVVVGFDSSKESSS